MKSIIFSFSKNKFYGTVKMAENEILYGKQ